MFSGVGRTTLDEARLRPVQHARARAVHLARIGAPLTALDADVLGLEREGRRDQHPLSASRGIRVDDGSASRLQYARRFFPTLSPALATACTASSNCPDAYVSRSRAISSGAIEGGGFGGSGFF